jgi:transposase
LAVVASTTAAVFEAYVDQVLAPVLCPEVVEHHHHLLLLLPGAQHKGERVRELIEERGCELLFLAPYSPDLNPIEEAFSKVKGTLGRTGARTRETLIEAIGRALDAVTAKDTQGFFEHCGYRFSAQSL